MKAKIWPTAKKIMLLVVSVFITLLLLEGLVRLISPQQTATVEYTYDQTLGDLPVPNQTGFVNEPGINYYTYHNNSLGMRGGEYSPEKSKPRILLLGNSYTYGQQVNDDKTFGSVLQKQSTAYEVVNGGNPGKGTDYQLTFFNALGYKFHPDIVFLSSVKPDFAANARQIYYGLDDKGVLTKKTLGSSIGSRKEFLQHLPFYGWLMEHSQFANLLKHAFISFVLHGNNHDDLVVDNGSTLHLTAPVVDITTRLMGALKKTAQEHGAKFVLLYIPDWLDVTEYREGKGISLSEKTITQIAADNHIELVSWTHALAQTDYTVRDLYVNGNGHLTVAGNNIVGLALYDYIKHSQPWLLK